MVLQFLISCVAGGLTFAAMDGEPIRVRLLGGFIVGLGAAWLVMRLYVRLRWGRSARITMDMR